MAQKMKFYTFGLCRYRVSAETNKEIHHIGSPKCSAGCHENTQYAANCQNGSVLLRSNDNRVLNPF